MCVKATKIFFVACLLNDDNVMLPDSYSIPKRERSLSTHSLPYADELR